MAVMNETRVTEFIFLGLTSNRDLQIVFFVLFLVMYLLTVTGNLFILITIYVDSHLHSPMYFFLSHLSFLDLTFSTVTVPRALVHFLLPRKTISYSECITQLFFFHFIGGTECFHLNLMAFDRYVAICNPLRYTTVMSRHVCLLLVVSTWIISCVSVSLQLIIWGEMAVMNETRVTEFILLGLTSNRDLQIIFFVLFLVMYLLTVTGNLFILITIYVDSHLHSPMYFFLSHLSFLDLTFSTVTVPRALVHFLLLRKTISYSECITQLFFFHFIGSTESFHLILMAYDRYVAICNPLRYTIVMSRQVCLLLVVSTWLCGFFHAFVQTFPAIQLFFCGPNEINYFFCDSHPLTVLACSSTYINEIIVMANSGTLSVVCFLMLSISYGYIISTILKIRSTEGRWKAFSTCASHLMVVTLFFGPCVFIYMRPPMTFAADKLVSIFYAIVTPSLNPFIYTLRNDEVKKSMKKLGGRIASFLGTHGN
ncbi:olfactory receptor 1509-like [Microcaecilia unicolor]|uniref:Olfactory receptor 1509-like n=1 Tax=Microcaecilia unicolor TaxID=1415580 RepID=A0A6P7WXD4_9AMPH|nr:olfactory receptor 1509-like [Microcaecilia unicolor]